MLVNIHKTQTINCLLDNTIKYTKFNINFKKNIFFIYNYKNYNHDF